MTTRSNSLFENDRYDVFADEYQNAERTGTIYGYIVLNKETGVVEFKIEQLPEAIMAAVQLNKMLDEEPWKQFEPVEVNPDGSPGAPEVH